MVDEAKLIASGLPLQAAPGRELIRDLLDLGIASLLTERHGEFD